MGWVDFRRGFCLTLSAEYNSALQRGDGINYGFVCVEYFFYLAVARILFWNDVAGSAELYSA